MEEFDLHSVLSTRRETNYSTKVPKKTEPWSRKAAKPKETMPKRTEKIEERRSRTPSILQISYAAMARLNEKAQQTSPCSF